MIKKNQGIQLGHSITKGLQGVTAHVPSVTDLGGGVSIARRRGTAQHFTCTWWITKVSEAQGIFIALKNETGQKPLITIAERAINGGAS